MCYCQLTAISTTWSVTCVQVLTDTGSDCLREYRLVSLQLDVYMCGPQQLLLN